MKFYLHTLGCPKNLVDAEQMASRLLEAGDVPVARAQDADVIVLNTCGFIGPARDESVATAEALAATKRAGQRLVVAGCLAEREPETVRQLAGVDVVLGTKRVAEIARACHDGLPDTLPPLASLDLTHGWRRVTGGPSAYVKIADGCDHACTFCTIPSFKGPLRSKPAELVLAEAELLFASGTKELVLVAQDSTEYGADLPARTDLASLLRALDARFGRDVWVRIMYAYPHHVSDDLLRAMAECVCVVPYLDVPLQHAHHATLRRMRRGGSAAAHLRLVERIRRAIPEVTIRSTFIVGFPGETEEEFATLLAFLEEARIERAGFFAYSRERGTPAGEMPEQVDEAVKGERARRAQEVQERAGLAANRAAIGRTYEVLVERLDTRWAVGRTVREAPDVDGEVHVRLTKGSARVGEFLRARISGATSSRLRAIQA